MLLKTNKSNKTMISQPNIYQRTKNKYPLIIFLKQISYFYTDPWINSQEFNALIF